MNNLILLQATLWITTESGFNILPFLRGSPVHLGGNYSVKIHNPQSTVPKVKICEIIRNRPASYVFPSQLFLFPKPYTSVNGGRMEKADVILLLRVRFFDSQWDNANSLKRENAVLIQIPNGICY